MEKSPFGFVAGCLVLLFAGAEGAGAANAVGYLNIPLVPGDNYVIALVGTDASLSDGFLAGVPTGTSVSKWDPTSSAFLAPSVFDGSWSENYHFTSGEGLLIHSDSAFTATSVFSIPFSEQPVITYPDASQARTIFVGSLRFGDSISPFARAIGRDALPGESVTRLDRPTQTLITTTFTANGWDNGQPGYGTVEAALFTLVPEPSSRWLFAFAASALLLRSARSRGRNRT